MRLDIAVLIVIAGMLASATMVAAIRRWAQRKAILDHPNARSSHSIPTPRGGGLAIAVLVPIGLTLTQVLTHAWPTFHFVVFVSSSILVATMSWIDDLYQINALIRLVVQIAAAGFIVISFGSWSAVALPPFGDLSLGAMSVPLTMFWIVGLTNAYNFMDGIDGLAAGQAVVAGLAWAWLGNRIGDDLVSVAGLLIAGSATGFLFFNWQPARIFMGDVGSAFLGFVFAALAVIAGGKQPRIALFGVLMVWPFVADTTFTLLRRTFRGERILTAHRSHVYQRLTQAGLSHSTVALLYVGLAVIGAREAAAVIDGCAIVGRGGVALLATLAVIVWAYAALNERRRRISGARGGASPPERRDR